MHLVNSRLLLPLIGLGLAATASAQEPVSLETITVEGTKEEKPLYQNTEGVSILQSRELPAAGSDNGLQSVNAVPNVQVNQSRTGESFSIRGINSAGVTGYQLDNLASVLVDGFFQTDLALQAGSFGLWDSDRIEILKGAQSTSQGVNSLAGTVLLDHVRPQGATEGAVRLGLGNFSYRDLSAVTNNVLASGKLFSRVSYDKELTNGYITNTATGNDKWGGWDRDRARAAFLYKFAEDNNLTFDGKFHQNRQGGSYVQGTDAFKHDVNENVDFRSETKNYQLSLNHEMRLQPSLSNTALIGYSGSDQSVNSDADGTAQDTAGIRFETHKDKFASFENRLLFKGESVSNLAGVHVHTFNLKDNFDFNLLFPIGGGASTPVAVTQDVDRTRNVYSVFDSLTYSIDKQNAVTVGGRAEYVETKYGADITGRRLQNLGGAGNTQVDNYVTQVSGRYDGTKNDVVLLPKVGYSFTNGPHYSGLTYTRGYRTAGISINRTRARVVEYEPEFTNNYELAYKYDGQGFQIATNAFFIDWSKQQVLVKLSNDPYDTQVQNAAKSEVYGAEIDGRINVGAKDRLSVGVGYVDSRFNDFKVSNADYTGNEFPFASHVTGRIGYDLNVTDQWKFLTVLRYVSDAYSNAENTRKSDAQFYTNLNTTYSLSDWVIEGYVNNVFNSDYRIYDGTPTSTSSPYQASYHQTSTPREFGARTTYYW